MGAGSVGGYGRPGISRSAVRELFQSVSERENQAGAEFADTFGVSRIIDQIAELMRVGRQIKVLFCAGLRMPDEFIPFRNDPVV